MKIIFRVLMIHKKYNGVIHDNESYKANKYNQQMMFFHNKPPEFQFEIMILENFKKIKKNDAFFYTQDRCVML